MGINFNSYGLELRYELESVRHIEKMVLFLWPVESPVSSQTAKIRGYKMCRKSKKIACGVSQRNFGFCYRAKEFFNTPDIANYSYNQESCYGTYGAL